MHHHSQIRSENPPSWENQFQAKLSHSPAKLIWYLSSEGEQSGGGGGGSLLT